MRPSPIRDPDMDESQPGNPLTIGIDSLLTALTCSLIIIGKSGDLSRRKLLPALYNLAFEGVLPINIADLGLVKNWQLVGWIASTLG